MKTPEFPQDEEKRLSTLCNLDILDSPYEERFDRLTRIAQQYFKVPIALVSIVDANRQWFKSSQGLDATETPRDISFCGHAILDDGVFVISNALEDPRFADNPLVTGPPDIRFYAGAPLSAPDGTKVGTLCIIDREPRVLNDDDIKTLRDLADCVEEEISQGLLHQFKSTLDLTLDTVFMFHADNLRFFYANRGAFEQIGYSPEELLTMHPYDIKPEVPRERFDALISPLLTGERDALTFETLHQHKNGSTIPVEIFLQYLAPLGERPRFVAIVRDISERNRLQERFRKVFDAAPNAMIMINQVGDITLVNQQTETLFGYSRGELLKQPVEMLLPENYRQGNASHEEGVFSVVQTRLMEAGRDLYGLCKDGREVPIEIGLSPLVMGEETYVLASVVDITERKQAEQVLRDREERLSAILENVVDGIITINSHGLIETFNPASEKIFGYHCNEVIGKNIKMLMPAPYQDEHDGYLKNYRDTREAKIIGIGREVEGLRRDGTTFPLELAVSEMSLDGQQVFTGIVRDITERKQAEKMKREFVSTVSHELRTPLTSIKGALGLIKSGVFGEMPDKLTRMIDIAHNNSERLVRLINDILDIEKIESGQMSFHLEPLLLHSLMEHCIEANRAYGAEHGVIFTFTSEAPDAQVAGDHDRLTQVMTNLMSNAAKFSPEGSTVDIVLRADQDRIHVEVKDYGPGIPESFHEKIFGKFAQADSSDTREEGGTGLGLNIARSIIENHGGRIGFTTALGKGTTFYFDLPRYQAGRDPLDSELDEATIGHILICEDDVDIANLLVRMLEQEGYTVDVAFSAAEARDLLQHRSYDGMTLDLGLPDMDGLALLRELRARRETAELPVVVISANAKQGAEDFQGEAIGVIDWHQKPIDQTRLAVSLRIAMSSSVMAKPRILHVEDDPDILQVVAGVVGDAANITPAKTFADAHTQLQKQFFDLVILDIGLPDGSGDELLSMMKSTVNRKTPVIVFSATQVSRELDENIREALVKSITSNEDLLQTIRSTVAAKKKTVKQGQSQEFTSAGEQ